MAASKKDAIDALVKSAKEAPVDDQQRPMEAGVLTALAKVANSELSPLLTEILFRMEEGDFYFQDHRDIFSAIKAIVDDAGRVDAVTVGDRLKGKHGEAVKVIFAEGTVDEGQTRAYMDGIIGRARVRLARRMGQDFIDAVERSDPKDVAGLVAGLEGSIFSLEKTKRLVPTLHSEADLLDDFVEDLKHPKSGYKTGFMSGSGEAWLDDCIKGLRPGLYVLSGTPGAGKTTFVKQLADQVAKENAVPVIFFSYEQSAAELRVKTLARLSSMENERIKEGKGDPKFLTPAVTEFKTYASWMKVVECDRQHTVGTIRMLVQREKMRTKKSPFVVIDYLQVMPSDDIKATDKRLQVDLLVSELRRLARDLDAPVLAISSMSREKYASPTAGLASFKESGGIEYTADAAFVMKVDKENEDADERYVTLSVVKNRNGRRRTFIFKYEMKFDRFAIDTFKNLCYTETIE